MKEAFGNKDDISDLVDKSAKNTPSYNAAKKAPAFNSITDYTAIRLEEAGEASKPKPAEIPPTQIETPIRAGDLKELICTQCYEISIPIHQHYGSWVVYTLACIIILPLIAVPSLLRLLLILFMNTSNNLFGGYDGIGSMNPFPLAGFIPQAPHTINQCRNCHAVNHMAEIDSKPGKDAMYWHLKKKDGYGLTADKQGNLSQEF